MQAALEKEPVLAADETPVNLLDPHAGLREDEAGAPHVLVVRTPHRGLTWLRALGSRQHAAITAILAFFTGFLISDGYGAYQELLPELAGVQQCCQHVIRRARAVTRLGPGSLQSWAADVIDILARPTRPSKRRWPGATRPSARSFSRTCAGATTRPSPSGSPITGTGTGTTATTPDPGEFVPIGTQGLPDATGQGEPEADVHMP
jgi:Transposase IS66 family